MKGKMEEKVKKIEMLRNRTWRKSLPRNVEKQLSRKFLNTWETEFNL